MVPWRVTVGVQRVNNLRGYEFLEEIERMLEILFAFSSGKINSGRVIIRRTRDEYFKVSIFERREFYVGNFFFRESRCKIYKSGTRINK